jgi:3-deoxy-manno-octulosonate cytidylyltransferase (CMP-KDO synthetase)
VGLHIIIPARYGSSRFPGKPLVDIAGKPMVRHVMERAAMARGVDSVTVATDDKRIKQAVEAFGGRAIMTPSVLRSGTDRVAAAAKTMGLGPDELVVNVQGDQPLLPPKVLEETAQPLMEENDLAMSTPVVAITRPEEIGDTNHVKAVMDIYGNALYFSRLAIPHPRDGAKVTYYKHLGIYIYRTRFLARYAELETGVLEQLEKLEQLRVLEAGYKVRCVITEFDSPEVDRPQDAERVAELIAEGA